MLLEVAGRTARVPLPPGWREQVDVAPGTAVGVEVAESAPGGFAPGGFASNLVLTGADNRGVSFHDWQVATDQVLPRMLTDYLLLDLERCEVAGHPGGRRLAHHLTPEGVAVTMEQWFAEVDGVGWTLTSTVDSFRYDEQADLLARVAADLRIGPEAAR